MMMKKHKTMLCAFSSIFRLQAGVFLQTRKGGVYFAADSVDKVLKTGRFPSTFRLVTCKISSRRMHKINGS